MALARLLEKYLGEAHELLEVGGADGIVAMAWDRLRRESHNESPLTYRMVEPVERMVEIVQNHANNLGLRLLPFVGTFDRVIASAQINDTDKDSTLHLGERQSLSIYKIPISRPDPIL
ncbi:MAG: hypothetical protein NUV84_04925 [Candidatus Uhrbacteria bacterium]|nr:hypothetical protein [Candidatus Uhrbacteria bacterium]